MPYIEPLYLFVFFGLFSPGPNVILLTASGARFGFAKTLPHILGVAAGVGVTSAVTGYGIGVLLTAQPVLVNALKVIACLWIWYLAYRLWISSAGQNVEETEQPFTFVEAVLFQWVNPKVWAVAVSASAYTIGMSAMDQAVTLGTAFACINLGVCLFWTFAGTVLAYLLNNAFAWRVFMRTMAILLIVFSIMVFL